MQGDSTIADADDVRHAGGAASAAESATRRNAARRTRRPLGSAVLHAPQVLRALVRADEIWLVVLAAFVGCATGISVWLMTATTQLVHESLFMIGPDERLSAMLSLDPFRTVLIPAIGGIVLGLVSLGLARLRPRRTVDPIEANALFGGR